MPVRLCRPSVFGLRSSVTSVSSLMPVLYHTSDSSNQHARPSEHTAIRLRMHDSMPSCNLCHHQSSKNCQFETCCQLQARQCCVVWPAEEPNLQGYHKHFPAFFYSPSGTCQQMAGPPTFLLSCAALCLTLHRRHSHSAVLPGAEHSESTGNPL